MALVHPTNRRLPWWRRLIHRYAGESTADFDSMARHRRALQALNQRTNP